MNPRKITLMIFLLLLSSAAGCAGTQALNAAVNSAIAVGVSADRRTDGECYTWCEKGTKCNPKTGMCEPLTCRGECKKGERCDDTAPVPVCVPATSNLVIIKKE